MNPRVESAHSVRPWFPMEHVPACCVPTPHIEVVGLSVTFAGSLAVRDVSMTIPKGCVTSIVGPSGCGKSTLLSALNRMTDTLPSCHVHGSVRLDGVELIGAPLEVRSLRRRIGLICQRPNPLPIAIADNIALPLKDHGVRSRHERAAIVESTLRDVGLWNEVADRLRRPALSLSGGQQQRLCIARCLALQPEVILLDEPCSALDPMATEVIEDLLGTLRHRYTVVLVTHNLAQARRVADFTAVLWQRERGSSLVEFGCTRQIFEKPVEELTSLYVGGVKG